MFSPSLPAASALTVGTTDTAMGVPVAVSADGMRRREKAYFANKCTSDSKWIMRALLPSETF